MIRFAHIGKHTYHICCHISMDTHAFANVGRPHTRSHHHVQVQAWLAILTNCLVFGFSSDQIVIFAPHLFRKKFFLFGDEKVRATQCAAIADKESVCERMAKFEWVVWFVCNSIVYVSDAICSRFW